MNSRLLAIALIPFTLCAAARADILPRTAIADSEVQYGSGASASISDTNYGTGLALDYRDNGAGTLRDQISFIKFNVSGINLATVTSVSLQFAFGYAGDGGTDPGNAQHYLDGQLPVIFGLNDGAAENWTELGITYNNAPAISHASPTGIIAGSATNLGVLYPHSLVSGTAIAKGSILPLRASFSDANPDGLGLLNFLKADTNGTVTFIIQDGLINSGRSVLSREDNEGFIAPTLTLTTSPEPASLALLTPAALLLLKRRK